MNKEEYYSRMNKINGKLSTDRCSADEEYHFECQKNYLSTKYIEFLENKSTNLQNRIDKAIEFTNKYKSQWVDNDEVINDMNNLLDILKGDDE